MIEFYKEAARYHALITCEKTGEEVEFKALVLEGPSEGKFYIRYSHSYRRSPEQGIYTPGPASFADSLEEADGKVREWVKEIENSYAVDPLDENL